MIAAAAGNNNWKAVIELVDKCPEADITALYNGWSVLHLACRSGVSAAVEAILLRLHRPDSTHIREAALEQRLESEGGFRNTPLMLACEFGRAAVVSLLVSAGASVVQCNTLQRSALTRALLGSANVYDKGLMCTCLMAKAAQSVPSAVYQLAKHMTNEGWQALHIAAHMGEAVLVEAILSPISDSERPGVVNSVQSYGLRSTALSLAAEKGNAECVKALLRMGADATLRDTGGACETALLKAVAHGRAAAVRAIVEHVALGGERLALEVVGAKRADGWRAIQLAVTNGSADVIDALLAPLLTLRSRQAVVNVRPFPIHTSVKLLAHDVCKLLLAHGASKTVRDDEGRTPIDLARFGVYTPATGPASAVRRDAMLALLGGSGPAIQPGDRVCLWGLQSKASLNGRCGVVVSLVEAKRRWLVQVDGAPVTPGAVGTAAHGALLRPANLYREGSAPPAPPAPPTARAAAQIPALPSPTQSRPSSTSASLGAASSVESGAGPKGDLIPSSLRLALASERLVACAEAALIELGATAPVDLLDLEADEFAVLPLKRLELKRLKRLIAAIAGGKRFLAADVAAPTVGALTAAASGVSAPAPPSLPAPPATPPPPPTVATRTALPVFSAANGPSPIIATRWTPTRTDVPTARVGRFHVGDRVRTLVAMDQWEPRSLAIGDEGTITDSAPPPHGATVNFGGTPELIGRLMITQLCQPDEWSARLGPYAVGDRVKSIVAANYTGAPRELGMGEEGVVLGPGSADTQLMCDWGGDPKLVAPAQFADVCPPAEWAERSRERLNRLGDLGVGDEVMSLIANPAWLPRPLEVGMRGEIEGPSPEPHHITVSFGGMFGRMMLSQVCSPEQWNARLAPYKRGDRVRARVPADHWRPRSLRAGDVGVLLGPAPPPHEITVDFGGTPPLTGMLKLAEVAKVGEGDADFAQQWPEPLGTFLFVTKYVVTAISRAWTAACTPLITSNAPPSFRLSGRVRRVGWYTRCAALSNLAHADARAHARYVCLFVCFYVVILSSILHSANQAPR